MNIKKLVSTALVTVAMLNLTAFSSETVTIDISEDRLSASVTMSVANNERLAVLVLNEGKTPEDFLNGDVSPEDFFITQIKGDSLGSAVVTFPTLPGRAFDIYVGGDSLNLRPVARYDGVPVQTRLQADLDGVTISYTETDDEIGPLPAYGEIYKSRITYSVPAEQQKYIKFDQSSQGFVVSRSAFYGNFKFDITVTCEIGEQYLSKQVPVSIAGSRVEKTPDASSVFDKPPERSSTGAVIGRDLPALPSPSLAPEFSSGIFEVSFSDLDGVPWAKDAITVLARHGVVNGVSKGVFDPDANVTREQFVTMLVKALGIELPDAATYFSDVNDSNYEFYISQAANAKIVAGIGEGRFGFGHNILRQDAAVLIKNALDYMDVDTSATVNYFSDFDSISDYAKDSVGKVAAKKIINGTPDGKFLPLEFLTRAETAVIINNMLTIVVYEMFELIESQEALAVEQAEVEAEKPKDFDLSLAEKILEINFDDDEPDNVIRTQSGGKCEVLEEHVGAKGVLRLTRTEEQAADTTKGAKYIVPIPPQTDGIFVAEFVASTSQTANSKFMILGSATGVQYIHGGITNTMINALTVPGTPATQAMINIKPDTWYNIKMMYDFNERKYKMSVNDGPPTPFITPFAEVPSEGITGVNITLWGVNFGDICIDSIKLYSIGE